MVPSNKTFTIQYDGHNYVTSRIIKSLPTKKCISYDNQKYSNLHDKNKKINYRVVQKING